MDANKKIIRVVSCKLISQAYGMTATLFRRFVPRGSTTKISLEPVNLFKAGIVSINKGTQYIKRCIFNLPNNMNNSHKESTEKNLKFQKLTGDVRDATSLLMLHTILLWSESSLTS